MSRSLLGRGEETTESPGNELGFPCPAPRDDGEPQGDLEEGRKQGQIWGVRRGLLTPEPDPAGFVYPDYLYPGRQTSLESGATRRQDT